MEKCTSWMGHKFEARYDIGPPDLSWFTSFKGYGALEMIKKLKPKKYVHDVCVCCGATVERIK